MGFKTGFSHNDLWMVWAKTVYDNVRDLHLLEAEVNTLESRADRWFIGQDIYNRKGEDEISGVAGG